MSLRNVLLMTCCVLSFGTAHAMAQSLRDVPTPAEFPPASYQGSQYIDSNGCVFVRAGVGDSVTWVPRMTRTREPLCGFAPTFASARPAAEPAPKPAAAPPVPATPQSAPPSAKPAAPRPAAVAEAPAPKPAARTSDPARTARVLTAPDPANTACADMTGVSAAYMGQHGGSPVRCGPQSTPHVTHATGSRVTTRPAAPPPPGTRASPDSVPAGTRVAPARIYASQQTSLAGISVPEGMKPVWEDDRLNPRRAHQTFEGKARMGAMWTNTVPRRLIDRRTGAAGVTVVTRGAYVPDPITARDASAPAQTVSTRSAPASAKPAETSKADATTRPRYAQAGIFADPAEARAAAHRIAGAGLPARQGRLSREGRDLTLVLAGPFASPEEAARGAARLRALGFGNVRLR